MIKKYTAAVIGGAILALAFSFFSHRDSIDNFIFSLGLYKAHEAEKDIERTLKIFNRNFSSFFNTGGRLEGLNEFPAANMIKRRVLQEVQDWNKSGRLLVYDKDSFELEGIEFLGPARAIAVAREVWFLNIQEKDTRRKLSPVKANQIRVRYIMKKVEGRWIVVEFEVFGLDDEIIPISKVSF